VIVLFQSDIRRALAQLGRGSRWLVALAPEERRTQSELVGVVARAAAELSRARVGALMVIERVADLEEVVQSGVQLEAAPSAELLLSIFQHASPLHDGAVVLRRGRVAASGCLLPLTSTPIVRDLGTRHRAALGLAEEVDALVVVVSEERGEISLAVDGTLSRGLDEGALRRELARLLVPVSAGPVEGLLVRLGLRPPRRAGDAKPEGDRAAL
jgi:diadenylate cyclase